MSGAARGLEVSWAHLLRDVDGPDGGGTGHLLAAAQQFFKEVDTASIIRH